MWHLSGVLYCNAERVKTAFVGLTYELGKNKWQLKKKFERRKQQWWLARFQASYGNQCGHFLFVVVNIMK